MQHRRLTEVERLVNASISTLMGQRKMFGRLARRKNRLKVEEGVLLAHIRVGDLEGKLMTATTLAEEADIDRRTAGRGLKKLVVRKEIVTEEIKTERKEIAYKNPPGFTYAPLVVDSVVEIVTDQINAGRKLERQVAKLEDESLKARIQNALLRLMIALLVGKKFVGVTGLVVILTA
jgi:predicted transcriptional regulator